VILYLNEPIFLSAVLVLYGKAIIPTSIVLLDIFFRLDTILTDMVYPSDRRRET
jgi:hypothetical protein